MFQSFLLNSSYNYIKKCSNLNALYCCWSQLEKLEKCENIEIMIARQIKDKNCYIYLKVLHNEKKLTFISSGRQYYFPKTTLEN